MAKIKVRTFIQGTVNTILSNRQNLYNRSSELPDQGWIKIYLLYRQRDPKLAISGTQLQSTDFAVHCKQVHSDLFIFSVQEKREKTWKIIDIEVS